MKLSEYLIGVGRPVAYYPKLRKITGSTNATIFLCQFVYWTGKESGEKGWIYKTSDDIEEETGLSYDEQKTAREKLKQAGLLEERYARLEHQMYFKVNLDMLNEKWGKPESAIPEHGEAALGKADSPHSLISNAENTTENTTETKKPDLVDGLMFYSEQAKARGEDAVEGVLNALERLLHRNIQRSGQWQDLARWMLKRNESEPYKKWADWYMADAFQAKTSWRLTPDQVRACWPQAFAAPEPAADDARYKPYTAENGLIFIKPEEAKEWERKWHLKKQQAEQLDKLPTAP